MDIVCFSINNWEKRKARKQQFMKHLALRSDVGKVLYVEPALNLWRLVFSPWGELKSQENRRRWKRAILSKREDVSEKLCVYTPVFFLPFGFRVYGIYAANLFLFWCVFRRRLKNWGYDDVVLWLYHPFDYPLLKWFFPRRCCCFDWAEEWADYFIEYSQGKKRAIKRLEEKMISNVDVVFVVSRELFRKACALNQRSYFLRDGTSPEIFASYQGPAPQDIINIKHPIIGYAGTFYDRLDIELIKGLSDGLPDSSIVFVGNIQHDRVDIAPLKGKKNIFFLSAKPYEQLPGYLMNFDVCLLPYKPEETSSPPTKIFDYLATGKPIVSTALPELEEMRPLIKLAGTREQFIDLVKESLSEKNEALSQKRREKAGENSWHLRAGEAAGILNEWYKS